MLIAYIDEVGEAGAFISKDHKRFKGYRTLRVAGRVTFRCVGAGKSVF